MSDVIEQLTLVIGGVDYREWEEGVVTAGVNQACRSFQLSTTEVLSEPFVVGGGFEKWNFPPFTPVQIYASPRDRGYASADLLVTGRVEKYAPSINAGSHRVQVSGRSRGGDFVDCSAIADERGGRFENETVPGIARGLDYMGVGISELSGGLSKTIPYFQIRQGSTAFMEMLRLTQQTGAYMMGLSLGGIGIGKGTLGMHAGALIQGVNIIDMSGLIDASGLFGKHEVSGQNSTSADPSGLEVHAEAIDFDSPGNRRRRIIDNAETDGSRAQQRADWELARSKGLSVQVQITTPGFRDQSGKIWEPGWVVPIQAPSLQITEAGLAIQSVDFIQGARGTVSRLTLVNPAALGGQNQFQLPFNVGPIWGGDWRPSAR